MKKWGLRPKVAVIHHRDGVCRDFRQTRGRELLGKVSDVLLRTEVIQKYLHEKPMLLMCFCGDRKFLR